MQQRQDILFARLALITYSSKMIFAVADLLRSDPGKRFTMDLALFSWSLSSR